MLGQASTVADPLQLMQIGLHYIRLTVENDITRDEIVPRQFGLASRTRTASTSWKWRLRSWNRP